MLRGYRCRPPRTCCCGSPTRRGARADAAHAAARGDRRAVGEPPATAMNVAFTFAGLGPWVCPKGAGLFPRGVPRRHGRARRAARRPRAERPSNWEGFDEAHVLSRVCRRRRDLEAALESASAPDAESERSRRPPPAGRGAGRRPDHFGFFDGIAQPAIEGTGVVPRPGDGQPDGAAAGARWPPARSLLGYRDEDGTLPAAPPRRSTATARSSCYASWRWTRPRFAASSPRWAIRAGPTRWRRSSSVAGPTARRWCSRPTARTRVSARAINDFGYADDPHGLRCPLGAHVRRANPRDSPASTTAG